MAKNPPAMQETWVQSLVWEDSLEKETATHSSIHAWTVPWTEEPGGLKSMASQIVRQRFLPTKNTEYGTLTIKPIEHGQASAIKIHRLWMTTI